MGINRLVRKNASCDDDHSSNEGGIKRRTKNLEELEEREEREHNREASDGHRHRTTAAIVGEGNAVGSNLAQVGARCDDTPEDLNVQSIGSTSDGERGGTECKTDNNGLSNSLTSIVEEGITTTGSCSVELFSGGKAVAANEELVCGVFLDQRCIDRLAGDVASVVHHFGLICVLQRDLSAVVSNCLFSESGLGTHSCQSRGDQQGEEHEVARHFRSPCYIMN